MVRSLLLLSLFVASAVLVHTTAAAGATYTPSLITLADLSKREDGSAPHSRPESAALKDFSERLLIAHPRPANTMDQTSGILQLMQMGLPFSAMQVRTHIPGDHDEDNFVVGENQADASTWPDGSYAQLLWCNDAINQTLFDAMQACGPKESCDADFVSMSFWGTAQGMDWVQDGVMLMQCLAYQTVKSHCAEPSTPPCKLSILGDFHNDMWPANAKVTFIGSGATTMPQMAQQMDEYNKAHKKSFSLPSGGKSKRGEMRRMEDDCDDDEY